MLFYVTLYQTKHNQKEESFTYHSICLALSKRIKRQHELIEESPDIDNSTQETSPDFVEGLKRTLSSLYAHTSKNVLSATMARKLLSHGQRFQFSHDFINIPLKHLLQWLDDNCHLDFKLKLVKTGDDTYEHVQDFFINNIIYRPVELEHYGCYDMMMHYELKKLNKKKIDSGSKNVESKTTFNLVKEHPSHKYMEMSRRKHIIIPSINSINLLPNVALLDLQSGRTNNLFLTKNTRENYAKIILLLFYPYRMQEDLRHEGSYWKRYKLALSENKISKKSLQVIQNIQDCQHNCSKLKTATDDLEKTTVYDAHEDDYQKGRNVDDDNCVDVNEIAEMFQHLDGMGVREVDPKQRRLKIIAERYNTTAESERIYIFLTYLQS